MVRRADSSDDFDGDGPEDDGAPGVVPNGGNEGCVVEAAASSAPSDLAAADSRSDPATPNAEEARAAPSSTTLVLPAAPDGPGVGPDSLDTEAERVARGTIVVDDSQAFSEEPAQMLAAISDEPSSPGPIRAEEDPAEMLSAISEEPTSPDPTRAILAVRALRHGGRVSTHGDAEAALTARLIGIVWRLCWPWPMRS